MMTGLYMAFTEEFAFLTGIFEMLSFIVGGGAYTVARSFHLLSTLTLFGVALIHVYSIIVFKMVRGIITGYRDEPVAS
jgi:hypothetical protein